MCIDINGAHPEGKATWQEWSDFLDEDLGVNPLEVKEVGVHTLTRLLMLQTCSDDEYQKLLSKLQEGVTWQKKDVTVYGWSHKEQLTTVRLMNVTGSLNLDLLRSKVEEYGRVVSWTLGKHPRYKNSFDNTITVKMMLKHEVKLPSFLPSPSTGEVIHLLSDTIGKACVRCLQSGHIAPHCRRNSRQFTEQASSKVWSLLPEGGTSYAQITSKPAQAATEKLLESLNPLLHAQQTEQQTETHEPVVPMPTGDLIEANAPSDIEHKEATSHIEPEKQKPSKLNLNNTKGVVVIETAGILSPGGTRQESWADQMATPKTTHPPSKLPEKSKGTKRTVPSPSSTEKDRPKRVSSLSLEDRQAREKLQAQARRSSIGRR